MAPPSWMSQPWMSQLERDGFVRLPGAIDADDAARLASLALRSLDDYATSDDLVKTDQGVPVKLLYPLDKYRDFVSVLGSHPVRRIVDAILPVGDSVLTWEDVLIKPPSMGVEVGVHQDIGLDPTRDTVHSLGISLNGDQDNPVFFLPGSHRLGPLTKDAVEALWQDCRDRFRPVVTRPGDVVIHNVHVLHHSEPNRSPRPRATWYLEFRSMSSLLENGPWSNDWVHRRRAIWVQARAASGDPIGDDEVGAVREQLDLLSSGAGTLRVPHVTEDVRYDSASPYNHFSGRNDDWKYSRPAPDATHHVSARDGQSLYERRFIEVLKFHAPGLAPVVDASGAYHITADGNATYDERHLRTFGFYEDIAAVHSTGGWRHIRPDGTPLYSQRYGWCGNFQEGRCPVRDADGRYFHIRTDGAPAYREQYRYAGDFRDGHAVVQNDAGDHTHIDINGVLLHGKWFRDLDVFHKGHARAADAGGWHHVDMAGRALYDRRFSMVEPFYNGQARVEGHDGSLSVIDEMGTAIVELRGPVVSTLENLSGDMVGTWRTQTIRAAAELGVFDLLPAGAPDVERALGLAPLCGVRLMRALQELALVRPDADQVYHTTDRGAHLRSDHVLSLSAAAGHWGGPSDRAWRGLAQSLRTGTAARDGTADDFFGWLAGQPDELRSAHRAFATYARHDYANLPRVRDFGAHHSVLDAGGGTGELAFALLRTNPRMKAIVMDRPEVETLFSTPDDLKGRCSFVAGDIFRKWPVRSDAVVLARVLHDWPDEDARRILARAREATSVGGSLYVVEMMLDETGGAGGLLDLNMLVMTGGRERSLREFQDLLADAGFQLCDARPTGAVNTLICARAV